MHRYVIGGIGFLVDGPLPDLSTDGFADAEIRVQFDDALAGGDRGIPTGRLLTGPMDLTGAIDPDSGVAWLPATATNPEARSWHLRQMAPIFSTGLGRLVLHAGAAETADGPIALVGESGAGKSTLAHFLHASGHRLVADDLLPVRFTPTAATPVGDRLRRIAAICVMTRTETRTVQSQRLPVIDALQRLIANGFGEHGDPELWRFQFDAYHRISETIPVFDLTIPDDLDALSRVEKEVARLAEASNDLANGRRTI